MRFGFVTCVELGLACMEEIYRVGGSLDLAITLRDDLAKAKSGRVYIDDFCIRRRIELTRVGSVNDGESIQAITSQNIDWLFIIGWSQIASRQVLGAPTKGCLGMHPTLLPQGRGRAAIPWAILKGLSQTGLTLFKLDEGVDTGPIAAQEVLQLSADETATSLYRRVADAHKTLIARVWPELTADRIRLRQQDNSMATHWPSRRPADGSISSDMTGVCVDRLVRATTHPYPGAFVDLSDKRYRIWSGRTHPGTGRRPAQLVDKHGHLWFEVGDGLFEATEWEQGTTAADTG